jgi:hypothetical protein
MKPNIFSIAFNYQRFGDEDMVTALWHYLLTAAPEVGQAFVDRLVQTTDLPPAKYLGALDHPVGDAENRPDLLLQTDSWQVLFEHKVDSPLGLRQLERYLDFARSRGWRLALMARRPLQIPESVAASSIFVSPSDASSARHFLWPDLGPLLKSVGHPLALEFVDFLEERGLGTFSWAGLGNPFYNPEAAEMLRLLYGATKPVFAHPGVRFMKKATSLVYEVRRPHPKVHLINIGPLESVAQSLPRLRGPVMGLWVWVQRGAGRESIRCLPPAGAVVSDAITIVASDTETAGPTHQTDRLVCERSYYAPLEDILVASPEQCNERIRHFAQVCHNHLLLDLGRP